MRHLDNIKTVAKQHWQELLGVIRIFKAETAAVEDVGSAHPADIQYAVSAARAVLHQDPRGARQILFVTAVFFLVAVLWMALATIEEQAHGSGKVIPSGHLQVIQNLEGGILAELYVREGQSVA